MVILSMPHAKKLKVIRQAEGMTQSEFAEALGIGLGTIKNYESGVKGVGALILDKVTNHPRFTKYTLWLMTGSIAPESGQIDPALSPDGHASTSRSQKLQEAG
ncbi:Helix-turn-helix [Sodalis glossinidius str. 'morsitans']|uniref:Helix-turn-helix n=2 Tax=Sodalis glossinidius (strain morsitans) TaxID=343509 RepID=A0A193QM05_SODGM|nr:helix-turn-helix domain-containing protein [Sodalis glossinidius]CRL46138.1 Helix-turn-helix [Sodalis glossinidius str. 'morsitans']